MPDDSSLKLETRYNRRTWLNLIDSEATASVVAFDGNVERRSGQVESVSFLEITDCTFKVRLHQMYETDARDRFLCKLRRLAGEVSRFADYLESSEPKATTHGEQ